MGVPWDECEQVGKLIGLKTMVNEFVAFEAMGRMELRVSRNFGLFRISFFFLIK